MNKLRLSRREWMLFALPFALLLLSHADRLRRFDSSELSMRFNPLVRARENALRSSCGSNLKQLGLAFAQYADDYDQRFPLNNSATSSWVYGTLPYTKSCPILHCPTDASSFKPMMPSYWMNGNLNEMSGRGVSYDDLDPQSTIKTYLLGDGDASVSKPNYTLTEKTWNSNAPYAKRHLFTTNFLFVDGHVKWFTPDAINTGQGGSFERKFRMASLSPAPDSLQHAIN